MRYGDKGHQVKHLQKSLIGQGYTLPKYGADGHLGDETWDALQNYAFDNRPRTQWKPDVPKSVLDDIYEPCPVVPIPMPPEPTPSIAGVKLYDLRNEQSNPPKMSRKFKLSAGLVVKRNPSKVTGITIHQTAAKYSVRDYQVQAASGDVELALARRAKNVACHVMAFHDGFIAWPNPLDWYVYHGNGFNRFELGVEVDGNYPGIIGGKTWNGKTPTVVTDKVVKAAWSALELLVTRGRMLGMPIEYIHAHRQSSAKRRDDPGEELWKRVVLDFAVPVLGLKVRCGDTLGTGQTIPKDWDSNGVGAY